MLAVVVDVVLAIQIERQILLFHKFGWQLVVIVVLLALLLRLLIIHVLVGPVAQGQGAGAQLGFQQSAEAVQACQGAQVQLARCQKHGRSRKHMRRQVVRGSDLHFSRVFQRRLQLTGDNVGSCIARRRQLRVQQEPVGLLCCGHYRGTHTPVLRRVVVELHHEVAPHGRAHHLQLLQVRAPQLLGRHAAPLQVLLLRHGGQAGRVGEHGGQVSVVLHESGVRVAVQRGGAHGVLQVALELRFKGGQVHVDARPRQLAQQHDLLLRNHTACLDEPHQRHLLDVLLNHLAEPRPQ
mmetsp:Transcript_313/g.690  ORF Transcript_313/g.690 Transcript_313/m.690 type:complete len:294 (-) Transcript_313:210-1091(-)